METLTIQIKGMSCGHCVGAVSRALKTVAGVNDANVKVGTATVQFDPTTATVAQMTHAVTDAVADAGYQVTEAA